MRERQTQLRWVEEKDQLSGGGQQVIERAEWEIPPESDRWFNIGLTILGIAAGAGIAALTVDELVVRAALGTLAVCLLAGGVSFLHFDHELNRGRRPKRSLVIEESQKIPSENG